jgi:hypothetical protein
VTIGEGGHWEVRHRGGGRGRYCCVAESWLVQSCIIHVHGRYCCAAKSWLVQSCCHILSSLIALLCLCCVSLSGACLDASPRGFACPCQSGYGEEHYWCDPAKLFAGAFAVVWMRHHAPHSGGLKIKRYATAR